MKTVGLHEAKTHLSRLVEEAARGQAFVIAKSGRPMVKVVAFDAGDAGTERRIGFMRGELEVPEDFDCMGADEIAFDFAGGSDAAAP